MERKKVKFSEQPLSQPSSKQFSMASLAVSNAITNATRNYMSMTYEELEAKPVTQTAEESEALREAYLSMIETPTWKQQMEDAATLVAENLMKDFEQQPIVEERITVASDGMLYEFNADVNKFIMIGRKDGCDVKLNDHGYATSRMHAMIMPFPQFNIYLVVDMGGLFGFDTLRRNSGKPCVSSRPNSRNVLVFDWNEIAVLELGSKKVAINPKECVICFERPRTRTFNCGHHTTCDECTMYLMDCPICRMPIVNAKSGFMMQTNINQ